ncbi:MAG: hypothetical protein NTW68_11760, partial [candidate division NC10 bacterium]|nr:hypothetical protein [candidate division NC10 bacterium]
EVRLINQVGFTNQGPPGVPCGVHGRRPTALAAEGLPRTIVIHQISPLPQHTAGERSPNDPAQAQPPERHLACKDDVRVSINGQLPGIPAVACSVLLELISWRQLKSSNHCRQVQDERTEWEWCDAKDQAKHTEEARLLPEERDDADRLDYDECAN